MIRFKKIKNIIKDIYGYDVNIHVTTQMKENLPGYAELNGNTIDIVVNANIAKSERHILVVVAHEVAEIYLKTTIPTQYRFKNIHRIKKYNEKHKEKLLNLLKRLAKEFNYKFDDLLYCMKELDEYGSW